MNSSPPIRATSLSGQAARQTAADLAEDAVALGVALRVIDALEAVQVQEDDGAGRMVETSLHRRPCASCSSGAVGQPVSASVRACRFAAASEACSRE